MSKPNQKTVDNNSEGQQSRIDAEIEQFIRQEKASRLRMGIAFAVGTLFFIGAGIFLFSTSDKIFKLPVDVDKGEEEVLAATNDPKCRGFISRVEKIGADYKAFIPNVDLLLKMDDTKKLQTIIDRLAYFRSQLQEERDYYPKINLRFNDSPAQLKKWFRYTDNEISILQDLAIFRRDQIHRIDEKKRLQNGDPNNIVLKPVLEKNGALVGSARINASKKTPQELFDGSYVASQEAFETFRVWHTGGLHPCGAADPGETPWTLPSKKTNHGDSFR